ncbi:hypothetical protein CL6EHI_137230 [Entamoeba histolytica]|uniref:Uncharacterized protein n=1 Tax=Entamoeba histolytica TaxID=5759 RepID=A0A175JT58_ENTHI|nr:hypothetical protein CL6EHI_137230 [Entamoeba histolytica]
MSKLIKGVGYFDYMADDPAIDKQSSRYKFTKWRNYQALQEAFFIGLLNQFATITICKPSKKTTVTIQFIKIQSIQLERQYDEIPFSSFIAERCKKRKSNDIKLGVPEKTAQRRFENNKFSEALHFLETVHSVYYNNKMKYSKKDIEKKGKAVNDYLCHAFKDNSQIKIKLRDEKITHIFC